MADERIVLSVIVPTKDNLEHLVRLLKTLDAQYLDLGLYEVLVVDDHSATDDVYRLVREFDCRYSLHYLKNRGEGILEARNHGAEEARGDYLLFLTDELMAPPGLLEAHHEAHKEHPHRVVRGPILPLHEEQIPMLEEPPPAVQLSFTAVNASLSKMALYKVGGFDVRTEPAYEDREIGWRLQQEGWTELFWRPCYVYYHRPEAEGGVLEDLREQAHILARSAVAHYSKHPDPKVAMATGIHPMVRTLSRIWAGDLMYELCRTLHDGTLGRQYPWARVFLEQRIYLNHYYRALARELKSQGLE